MLPILGLIASLAGVGCASKSAVSAWQDSLTAYVGEQGQGDPAVLSELPLSYSTNSLRPASIRFSKLDVKGNGFPPFAGRWDVHGVLLYSKVVDPAYHPFLIGVISRPYWGPTRLEDIRLAIFEVDGENLHWRISGPDPESVHRYLQALGEAEPGRATRHPTIQVFPALDDVFQFEWDGSVAEVRDERSGATWRIALRKETDSFTLK